MAEPRSNRIAQHRRAKGMSQQQLADAVGVHWVTISKLERGLTKFNLDWAERLAVPLEVDAYDLLPPRKPIRRIALSGYVYNGGEVSAIEEGVTDTWFANTDLFDDLGTDWLEIKGDALYPYFRHQDVIGITWAYDDERRNEDNEIDYSEFFGRLCLVETEGGEQNIGHLMPGSSTETVTLQCINAPPRANIKPVSIAQVTVAFMSRPLTRTDEGAE